MNPPALRPRRRLRRLLAWSSVLIAAPLVVAAMWGLRVASARVADPSMSLPNHAEAVLVFFGGEDRAPAAAELMGTGIADTLVINHGLKNGRLAEAFSPLCEDPLLDYEVICVVAEPSNTAGEARVFSELAAERGWSTLIAFTSDFHLERAQFRLERCFDGAIYGQTVDSANAKNEGREARKLLVAWTLQRGC